MRCRTIFFLVFLFIAGVVSGITWLVTQCDKKATSEQYTSVTTIQNINTSDYQDSSQESEKEFNFADNAEKIINQLDSAVNKNNYSNSNLDDLINEEESFLRISKSLSNQFNNLNYPSSLANFRNNICGNFNDICKYERNLIYALEDENSDDYEFYLNRINRSLESLINNYNSMVTYLNNKY